MPALDPLGINPFFSTAAQTTKKKEKKTDTITTKSTRFDVALEKEQLLALESTDLPLEIRGKTFDETLQYLIDSVYAAGDKLKKEPYADEFKTYRKTLSQFMNFVIKNSYEKEKHKRLRGDKTQMLTLVQTVNTKLDELAIGILYEQREPLKILAKIEELKGILVDFFS